MFRVITAGYSEKNTVHKNKICRPDTRIFNVEDGGTHNYHCILNVKENNHIINPNT